MITWFEPHISNFGISRCPGSWTSSTKEDLNIFEQQQVEYVVCLQQEHELERLEPPETISIRRQSLEQLGMSMLHEPIEDFCAPSMDQTLRILAHINQQLQRQHKVVVHCQAGLGRAGTIAACLLIEKGMSTDGAISMVRWLRPGAIQSQSQEQLIADFEQSLVRAFERYPNQIEIN